MKKTPDNSHITRQKNEKENEKELLSQNVVTEDMGFSDEEFAATEQALPEEDGSLIELDFDWDDIDLDDLRSPVDPSKVVRTLGKEYVI